MALRIPVQKDIGEYEEKIVGKMSLRTLACVSLGFGSAVGAAAFVHLGLHADVADAAFPIMLCSMPFWLAGFWRPFGMRAEELLPLLAVEEEVLSVQPEGWFLSQTEQTQWDAQKTAVYRLLTGRGEEFTFWMGEHPLTLRRPLLSVAVEGDGSFAVRLDCQTAADSADPTPEELAQLGTLCTQLLQERWQAGQDLIGLGACAALRDGSAARLDPTKNACPQLRTDVAVY